jgi:hypothetical protein
MLANRLLHYHRRQNIRRGEKAQKKMASRKTDLPPIFSHRYLHYQISKSGFLLTTSQSHAKQYDK